MAGKQFVKKHENWIGTGILLLVMLLFVAIRYDYYYDLNDDVLMKDILAGVYTGVPEGHNIQMLWPISALLSLFYRMGRGVPWYGLFLCVCHYGSIGLIAYRSLRFCRTSIEKCMLLAIEGALFLGLFLPHLVSAQYTITCTLLASAAAFLFYTTDITLPAGKFIRQNIGVILLVSLAYLVRSEMLLLVMPLICVAGVMKWGSEKVIFTREHTVKYLAVIGGILAGLLLGQLCHNLAYGSKEWKTFTEYFNNRTELYDFQTIPEYEEHQAFYEGIGLTAGEMQLLKNYNFGLDEEIDEEILGEIAAYAAENRSAGKPFMERLKSSIGQYYRRTFYGPGHNESDAPWSYVVIFSYLAVLTAAKLCADKKSLGWLVQIGWKLGFLAVVRSVLWLWLIMRDRVPVRISHSMYLMELAVLLGMLMVQLHEIRQKEGLPGRRWYLTIIGALYLAIGIMIVPLAVADTDADVAYKEENNARYKELYAYLSSEENRENFYFIDVYSSVLYTEKMFVQVDNSLDNYDIMGGWACKSPLWQKKLAAFGIENMEEALPAREDVFYVQEAGADTKWLKHYYKDHGVEITLKQEAAPTEAFEIYQIQNK